MYVYVILDIIKQGMVYAFGAATIALFLQGHVLGGVAMAIVAAALEVLSNHPLFCDCEFPGEDDDL